MKIKYPTIEKDTEVNEDLNKEKIAKYYGHNNSLGFFPIGRLNAWHGGVHIEGNDQKIQAMADGRIIAYRIPSDYYPREETIDSPKYSNGFVLMQHNYESPKEQKFRFYSLYMHLLPNAHTKPNDIPEVFAKYSGKVKGSEVMAGLNARSGSELEKNKNRGKVITVIPVGETVTLDPLPTEPTYLEVIATSEDDPSAEYVTEFPETGNTFPLFTNIDRLKYRIAKRKIEKKINNHWSNSSSYKKSNYQRIKYKNYTDIYIATTSTYVKDLGNGQLQIISIEDKITGIDSTATKGAVVYDKANNTGKGKYLRTMAKGSDLGELEKVSDTWYKIKGKEEYIFADALTITKSLKSNIILDKVKNDDIPVNAGTLLGYSGLYGFKNHPGYKAVHLEVFTDDDQLQNFLSNDPAGDNDKISYEIAKGKALKVGKPVNYLKKETKVKVYRRNKNFTLIGFENVEGIINYDYLEEHNNAGNFTHYTIKPSCLHEVSEDLGCDFDAKDKLRYIERVDENGTKINLNTENQKITNAELNGETYTKRRKVSLIGEHTAENFWVKSDAVPEEYVIRPKPLKSKGIESIQLIDGKYEAVSSTEDLTEDDRQETGMYWIRLTEDISFVFDFRPNEENIKDIQVPNTIQVQRICSQVTDNKDQKWCKIRGFYFIDNTKTLIEGWIQESDLTEINPYNWNECGWQLKEDAGNQYFYQFDANKGDKPHTFIENIWKLVDLPEKRTQPDGSVKEVSGDKVLTQGELQRAMRIEEKANVLSKLVCKHSSEWDTWNKIDAFKQEVESIYKQGIDEEEDENEKKLLEEIRDERISQMEEKIQNLCFWPEIQDGNIGTPVKGAEARTFPQSNSNVYHFHPIAFVEQMKIISGGLVYDIYYTGEVIPSGDLDKAVEVRLVYHDKDGVMHQLGSYKLIEIDTYENGKKSKPKDYSEENYKVLNSSAYNNKPIYYKKLNEKVKVINITEKMKPATGQANYCFNYIHDDFTINFYVYSTRVFAQPKCFASFIGAVVETGYKDIRITGFTSQDGTGSPSLSHPLGINVDISNLDKETENPTGAVKIQNSNFSRERTRNLANALIKFGYHAIRTSDAELCTSTKKNTFDYTNKQKPCKHISGHNDHLHCERYQY